MNIDEELWEIYFYATETYLFLCGFLEFNGFLG